MAFLIHVYELLLMDIIILQLYPPFIFYGIGIMNMYPNTNIPVDYFSIQLFIKFKITTLFVTIIYL